MRNCVLMFEIVEAWSKPEGNSKIDIAVALTRAIYFNGVPANEIRTTSPVACMTDEHCNI